MREFSEDEMSNTNTSNGHRSKPQPASLAGGGRRLAVSAEHRDPIDREAFVAALIALAMTRVKSAANEEERA